MTSFIRISSIHSCSMNYRSLSNNLDSSFCFSLRFRESRVTMKARRSANYEASVWDADFIRSLTTSYTREKHADEAEKLKIQVQMVMDETTDELDQLQLIDDLQRLGICYHFQDPIATMLRNIYDHQNLHDEDEKNLHATSLRFRLLRQRGYHVPQDVFGSFMAEAGDFEASLAEDVRGLVSLYEASYLSMEGEDILDLAKEFSTHHLKERVKMITDEGVAEQVRHALELPLHWRMQRLEARWFIQLYESRPDANLVILKLAKLDFNMVQATYLEELKLLSSWYEETGLPEKLSFVRHRLAECFMWSIGSIPEAHLGDARVITAKNGVMVTLLDDIYDIYGTLEELKVLTETMERWDVNSSEGLPEYMQMCFLTLFNLGNELAHQILRDHGMNVVSSLRRFWAEQSGCWYNEAKWFHSGYVPTTDEYLNTAITSIGGPLLLLYGYLTTTNPINKLELQSLNQLHGIIRWPSMVLRLADDLETSSHEMKRGDVPKSIQCYMNETGCSEEEARRHVKHLIEVGWKRMNKDILMEKGFKDFTHIAMNLGRISLCFYQHGDGFGIPHSHTNKNLLSLIVQPIHIP